MQSRGPIRQQQGKPAVAGLRDACDEQPWWRVRPGELASRYGHDSRRLRGDIDPEDLSGWQFDLLVAALEACDQWARGSMPEPDRPAGS